MTTPEPPTDIDFIAAQQTVDMLLRLAMKGSKDEKRMQKILGSLDDRQLSFALGRALSVAVNATTFAAQQTGKDARGLLEIVLRTQPQGVRPIV